MQFPYLDLRRYTAADGVKYLLSKATDSVGSLEGQIEQLSRELEQARQALADAKRLREEYQYLLGTLGGEV